MSENLDQYQDFFANDVDELNKRTDKHVKRGYKILTTIAVREEPPLFLRTMYLSSSVDLKKYEGFVNVPIGDETQTGLEENGYTPIASYSKHITWAYPKETKTSEPSDK